MPVSCAVSVEKRNKHQKRTVLLGLVVLTGWLQSISAMGIPPSDVKVVLTSLVHAAVIGTRENGTKRIWTRMWMFPYQKENASTISEQRVSKQL